MQASPDQSVNLSLSSHTIGNAIDPPPPRYRSQSPLSRGLMPAPSLPSAPTPQPPPPQSQGNPRQQRPPTREQQEGNGRDNERKHDQVLHLRPIPDASRAGGGRRGKARGQPVVLVRLPSGALISSHASVALGALATRSPRALGSRLLRCSTPGGKGTARERRVRRWQPKDCQSPGQRLPPPRNPLSRSARFGGVPASAPDHNHRSARGGLPAKLSGCAGWYFRACALVWGFRRESSPLPPPQATGEQHCWWG